MSRRQFAGMDVVYVCMGPAGQGCPRDRPRRPTRADGMIKPKPGRMFGQTICKKCAKSAGVEIVPIPGDVQ